MRPLRRTGTWAWKLVEYAAKGERRAGDGVVQPEAQVGADVHAVVAVGSNHGVFRLVVVHGAPVALGVVVHAAREAQPADGLPEWVEFVGIQVLIAPASADGDGLQAKRGCALDLFH